MKRVLLYEILVFITHGKGIQLHKKTRNLNYQLQNGMIILNYHDESHSVSDIQDYFEYILETMEKIMIIYQ